MVIEPRDRHIDGLTNDATPGASDHQQIAEASVLARLSSSSFFLLAPPFSPPPFSLSLSLSLFLVPPEPAIICYVRDSKLTAILASCHSYVLPFVSRPSTQSASPSRSHLVASSASRVFRIRSANVQHAARITGGKLDPPNRRAIETFIRDTKKPPINRFSIAALVFASDQRASYRDMSIMSRTRTRADTSRLAIRLAQTPRCRADDIGLFGRALILERSRVGVKFKWTADRTRSASRGLPGLVAAALFKGFGGYVGRARASWPHQSCYKARLSRRGFPIARSTPVASACRVTSRRDQRENTASVVHVDHSRSYRYQTGSQDKPYVLIRSDRAFKPRVCRLSGSKRRFSSSRPICGRGTSLVSSYRSDYR